MLLSAYSVGRFCQAGLVGKRVLRTCGEDNKGPAELQAIEQKRQPFQSAFFVVLFYLPDFGRGWSLIYQ